MERPSPPFYGALNCGVARRRTKEDLARIISEVQETARNPPPNYPVSVLCECGHWQDITVRSYGGQPEPRALCQACLWDQRATGKL